MTRKHHTTIHTFAQQQQHQQHQNKVLSGGELQRFACATVCVQKADVYMFDEPSSYLDVKQRLKVARAIRVLRGEKK